MTPKQVELELYRAIVKYVDQSTTELSFTDDTVREIFIHKMRASCISGVSMTCTFIHISEGKVAPKDMLDMIDNIAVHLGLKKINIGISTRETPTITQQG